MNGDYIQYASHVWENVGEYTHIFFLSVNAFSYRVVHPSSPLTEQLVSHGAIRCWRVARLHRMHNSKYIQQYTNRICLPTLVATSLHKDHCDRPMHLHVDGTLNRMRKCQYIPQSRCRICRHVATVANHSLHVSLFDTACTTASIWVQKKMPYMSPR
jgi:hypothetical protein